MKEKIGGREFGLIQKRMSKDYKWAWGGFTTRRKRGEPGGMGVEEDVAALEAQGSRCAFRIFVATKYRVALVGWRSGASTCA